MCWDRRSDESENKRAFKNTFRPGTEFGGAMSNQHSVIVDQKSPAGNAGLEQVGSAFRIRKRDGTTDEHAVFRCHGGCNEVYRLWQVRSCKKRAEYIGVVIAGTNINSSS